LADIRERTETDQPAAGHDGGGEPSTAGRRRRRPFLIAVGIVVAVVVYALAFEHTQVDLTQISSETRRASLERILRALAHPDLVTYDTREETIEVEIAIPCGPEVTPHPDLVIEPSCGDPGESVTITGTGFEPREFVELRFVPDTEFDITLRLASVNADSDGRFQVDVVLPDRPSERAQTIRAVTQEPIGTWRNRVEVFTDANENGVEDDPILGEDGLHIFEVAGRVDVPAVALINPAGETTDFVTAGESFEAVSGVARGQVAIPITEERPDTGLRITGIEASGGNLSVTIEGPPGFDMSNWRAAAYDGVTGEPAGTTFISDTIRLSPRISETARITFDKILETVFLALVATTAGLLVAVPLSFIAARNIMRDISVTVTNLVLILIAVPVGAALGVLASRAARDLVAPFSDDALALVGVLVVAVALAYGIARMALPTVEDHVPTRAERVRRAVLLVVAGALALVGLLVLALLFQSAGTAARSVLGWFGFVGSFVADLGEIFDVAFVLIAALAGAGVLAQLASKLGYAIRRRTPRSVVGVLDVVMGAAAGALWAVLVGQVIDWFYRIDEFRTVVLIPAVVGAVVGVLVALRGMQRGEVRIGLSIYYAARTVFNTLRSIEPLVMAIVFVVWVGAGPFAGSLALALHTAAALAKLYSEQVESISPGPIEAVRATGANRLQTIIYSVVPQIVPPYISFTMYRWDINVRMSTILGFVGGGGIGSILQQNINLLNYRAAAVQMLAIAIVVATMDWASSRLRERYV
jgi:phosphonate ABC transporter permease subunit PhnE